MSLGGHVALVALQWQSCRLSAQGACSRAFGTSIVHAVDDNLLLVDRNRRTWLTVCRSALVHRYLIAGFAPLVYAEYIFNTTNMEFLKGRLDRATLQRLVDLLPGLQEAAQPLGGCGQVLCGLFLVVGWIILCVSRPGTPGKLLGPAAEQAHAVGGIPVRSHVVAVLAASSCICHTK